MAIPRRAICKPFANRLGALQLPIKIKKSPPSSARNYMPMFKLYMPNISTDTNSVLLDISRIIRVRNNKFSTGVDRIDLAICLNFLNSFNKNCHFIYASPVGALILPHELGRELLVHLNAKWNGQPDEAPVRNFTARQWAELLVKRSLRSTAAIINADTTYVVASHSGLGKVPGALRRLDPQQAMRRVVYLHDVIPIDMPEYQRPGTREAFDSYLQEVIAGSVTIVSNSRDTDKRVRSLAQKRAWQVQDFCVAMPSLEITRGDTLPVVSKAVNDYLTDPRPFFTIVGTIEPRKNHLLLLNIWRQFALAGVDAPRLCIIGKRGWENENIIDMLDRCDVIRESVREFATLSDYEVQVMMKASRALLMPSFIEGLGIPVLEAAALGVPCIASHLDVFTEIAPEGTVFLDPLDGLGWKQAILDRAKIVPDPGA